MLLTQEQFNKLSSQGKAICSLFDKKDCLDCPFLEGYLSFCTLDGSIEPQDQCNIPFASIDKIQDVYNEYFGEE